MECSPCRAYIKWNYRGDAKKQFEAEIKSGGSGRKLRHRQEVEDYQDEQKSDGRQRVKW